MHETDRALKISITQTRVQPVHFTVRQPGKKHFAASASECTAGLERRRWCPWWLCWFQNGKQSESRLAGNAAHFILPKATL